MGDAVTWGETKLLIEQAAEDPSTVFGAELAGWAFPASMPELLGLVGHFGKNAPKVMPWVMPNPRRDAQDKATPDEVAAAIAELEDGIVFGS